MKYYYFTMKILFILIVIITLVNAKCGITYTNSVDTDIFCNDMEMYGQCNSAQGKIEVFMLNLINYINENNLINNYHYDLPDLGCYLHISCMIPIVILREDRDKDFYYCQNINAFNQCKKANEYVNNFILDISEIIEEPNIYKKIMNKPKMNCTKSIEIEKKA